MDPDALDGLARQVAATPTSRRATIKAVAAAIAVGPLLSLPSRTSKLGLPPAGAVPASSLPVCDYSAGALPCLSLLGTTAACFVKCETVILCGACIIDILNKAKACSDKLNCHCPAGTTTCEYGIFADQECCDPSEECTFNGCRPPCGPCERRGWWGGCFSLCLDGQTCKNGQCACPSGQKFCEGKCTDISTDNDNCGDCGIVCGANQTCCKGTCVNLCSNGAPPDPNSCTCPSSLVYCPCNNSCYSDVTVCLNNCQVTLGCFTDICGSAQSGQC